MDQYLSPTAYIDSDHPDVADHALDLVRGASSDVEKALASFCPIRDDVRYTAYGIEYTPEALRASYTLRAGKGFCVQKAVLLAAASRAVGVPSRLGFADVRNHLATKRLLEALGTDVFIYHGYTELFLNERWVKATPAFNIALCEKFGVLPLDFDGENDSVLQLYDRSGNRHMEYIRDHGAFADLPFTLLRDEYAAKYPKMFGPFAEVIEGDFAAEAAQESRAPAP